MIRLPPGPTRTYTPFPYSTLFRSRIAAHRARANIAFGLQARVRKLTVPIVRQDLASGLEFVAPCEFLPVDAAPRREFPFGLAWKRLARPSGIGLRIRERSEEHTSELQ